MPKGKNKPGKRSARNGLLQALQGKKFTQIDQASHKIDNELFSDAAAEIVDARLPEIHAAIAARSRLTALKTQLNTSPARPAQQRLRGSTAWVDEKIAAVQEHYEALNRLATSLDSDPRLIQQIEALRAKFAQETFGKSLPKKDRALLAQMHQDFTDACNKVIAIRRSMIDPKSGHPQLPKTVGTVRTHFESSAYAGVFPTFRKAIEAAGTTAATALAADKLPPPAFKPTAQFQNFDLGRLVQLPGAPPPAPPVQNVNSNQITQALAQLNVQLVGPPALSQEAAIALIGQYYNGTTPPAPAALNAFLTEVNARPGNGRAVDPAAVQFKDEMAAYVRGPLSQFYGRDLTEQLTHPTQPNPLVFTSAHHFAPTPKFGGSAAIELELQRLKQDIDQVWAGAKSQQEKLAVIDQLVTTARANGELARLIKANPEASPHKEFLAEVNAYCGKFYSPTALIAQAQEESKYIADKFSEVLNKLQDKLTEGSLTAQQFKFAVKGRIQLFEKELKVLNDKIACVTARTDLDPGFKATLTKQLDDAKAALETQLKSCQDAADKAMQKADNEHRINMAKVRLYNQLHESDPGTYPLKRPLNKKELDELLEKLKDESVSDLLNKRTQWTLGHGIEISRVPNDPTPIGHLGLQRSNGYKTGVYRVKTGNKPMSPAALDELGDFLLAMQKDGAISFIDPASPGSALNMMKAAHLKGLKVTTWKWDRIKKVYGDAAVEQIKKDFEKWKGGADQELLARDYQDALTEVAAGRGVVNDDYTIELESGAIYPLPEELSDDRKASLKAHADLFRRAPGKDGKPLTEERWEDTTETQRYLDATAQATLPPLQGMMPNADEAVQLDQHLAPLTRADRLAVDLRDAEQVLQAQLSKIDALRQDMARLRTALDPAGPTGLLTREELEVKLQQQQAQQQQLEHGMQQTLERLQDLRRQVAPALHARHDAASAAAATREAQARHAILGLAGAATVVNVGDHIYPAVGALDAQIQQAQQQLIALQTAQATAPAIAKDLDAWKAREKELTQTVADLNAEAHRLHDQLQQNPAAQAATGLNPVNQDQPYPIPPTPASVALVDLTAQGGFQALPLATQQAYNRLREIQLARLPEAQSGLAQAKTVVQVLGQPQSSIGSKAALKADIAALEARVQWLNHNIAVVGALAASTPQQQADLAGWQAELLVKQAALDPLKAIDLQQQMLALHAAHIAGPPPDATQTRYLQQVVALQQQPIVPPAQALISVAAPLSNTVNPVGMPSDILQRMNAIVQSHIAHAAANHYRADGTLVAHVATLPQLIGHQKNYDQHWQNIQRDIQAGLRPSIADLQGLQVAAQAIQAALADQTLTQMIQAEIVVIRTWVSDATTQAWIDHLTHCDAAAANFDQQAQIQQQLVTHSLADPSRSHPALVVGQPPQKELAQLAGMLKPLIAAVVPTPLTPVLGKFQAELATVQADIARIGALPSLTRQDQILQQLIAAQQQLDVVQGHIFAAIQANNLPYDSLIHQQQQLEQTIAGLMQQKLSTLQLLQAMHADITQQYAGVSIPPAALSELQALQHRIQQALEAQSVASTTALQPATDAIQPVLPQATTEWRARLAMPLSADAAGALEQLLGPPQGGQPYTYKDLLEFRLQARTVDLLHTNLRCLEQGMLSRDSLATPTEPRKFAALIFPRLLEYERLRAAMSLMSPADLNQPLNPPNPETLNSRFAAVEAKLLLEYRTYLELCVKSGETNPNGLLFDAGGLSPGSQHRGRFGAFLLGLGVVAFGPLTPLFMYAGSKMLDSADAKAERDEEARLASELDGLAYQKQAFAFGQSVAMSLHAPGLRVLMSGPQLTEVDAQDFDILQQQLPGVVPTAQIRPPAGAPGAGVARPTTLAEQVAQLRVLSFLQTLHSVRALQGMTTPDGKYVSFAEMSPQAMEAMRIPPAAAVLLKINPATGCYANLTLEQLHDRARALEQNWGTPATQGLAVGQRLSIHKAIEEYRAAQLEQQAALEKRQALESELQALLAKRDAAIAKGSTLTPAEDQRIAEISRTTGDYGVQQGLLADVDREYAAATAKMQAVLDTPLMAPFAGASRVGDLLSPSQMDVLVHMDAGQRTVLQNTLHYSASPVLTQALSNADRVANAEQLENRDEIIQAAIDIANLSSAGALQACRHMMAQPTPPVSTAVPRPVRAFPTPFILDYALDQACIQKTRFKASNGFKADQGMQTALMVALMRQAFKAERSLALEQGALARPQPVVGQPAATALEIAQELGVRVKAWEKFDADVLSKPGLQPSAVATARTNYMWEQMQKTFFDRAGNLKDFADPDAQGLLKKAFIDVLNGKIGAFNTQVTGSNAAVLAVARILVAVPDPKHPVANYNAEVAAYNAQIDVYNTAHRAAQPLRKLCQAVPPLTVQALAQNQVFNQKLVSDPTALLVDIQKQYVKHLQIAKADAILQEAAKFVANPAAMLKELQATPIRKLSKEALQALNAVCRKLSGSDMTDDFATALKANAQLGNLAAPLTQLQAHLTQQITQRKFSGLKFLANNPKLQGLGVVPGDFVRKAQGKFGKMQAAYATAFKAAGTAASQAQVDQQFRDLIRDEMIKDFFDPNPPVVGGVLQPQQLRAYSYQASPPPAVVASPIVQEVMADVIRDAYNRAIAEHARLTTAAGVPAPAPLVNRYDTPLAAGAIPNAEHLRVALRNDLCPNPQTFLHTMQVSMMEKLAERVVNHLAGRALPLGVAGVAPAGTRLALLQDTLAQLQHTVRPAFSKALDDQCKAVTGVDAKTLLQNPLNKKAMQKALLREVMTIRLDSVNLNAGAVNDLNARLAAIPGGLAAPQPHQVGQVIDQYFRDLKAQYDECLKLVKGNPALEAELNLEFNRQMQTAIGVTQRLVQAAGLNHVAAAMTAMLGPITGSPVRQGDPLLALEAFRNSLRQTHSMAIAQAFATAAAGTLALTALECGQALTAIAQRTTVTNLQSVFSNITGTTVDPAHDLADPDFNCNLRCEIMKQYLVVQQGAGLAAPVLPAYPAAPAAGGNWTQPELQTIQTAFQIQVRHDVVRLLMTLQPNEYEKILEKLADPRSRFPAAEIDQSCQPVIGMSARMLFGDATNRDALKALLLNKVMEKHLATVSASTLAARLGALPYPQSLCDITKTIQEYCAELKQAYDDCLKLVRGNPTLVAQLDAKFDPIFAAQTNYGAGAALHAPLNDGAGGPTTLGFDIENALATMRRGAALGAVRSVSDLQAGLNAFSANLGVNQQFVDNFAAQLVAQNLGHARTILQNLQSSLVSFPSKLLSDECLALTGLSAKALFEDKTHREVLKTALFNEILGQELANARNGAATGGMLAVAAPAVAAPPAAAPLPPPANLSAYMQAKNPQNAREFSQHLQAYFTAMQQAYDNCIAFEKPPHTALNRQFKEYMQTQLDAYLGAGQPRPGVSFPHAFAGAGAVVDQQQVIDALKAMDAGFQGALPVDRPDVAAERFLISMQRQNIDAMLVVEFDRLVGGVRAPAAAKAEKYAEFITSGGTMPEFSTACDTVCQNCTGQDCHRDVLDSQAKIHVNCKFIAVYLNLKAVALPAHAGAWTQADLDQLSQTYVQERLNERKFTFNMAGAVPPLPRSRRVAAAAAPTAAPTAAPAAGTAHEASAKIERFYHAIEAECLALQRMATDVGISTLVRQQIMTFLRNHINTQLESIRTTAETHPSAAVKAGAAKIPAHPAIQEEDLNPMKTFYQILDTARKEIKARDRTVQLLEDFGCGISDLMSRRGVRV